MPACMQNWYPINNSDIFSIPDADARDSAILHRAPDQLFSNSHHRSALLQLCRRFPDGADMWKGSIPFKAEETVDLILSKEGTIISSITER